jgi:hypothetical protein
VIEREAEWLHNELLDHLVLLAPNDLLCATDVVAGDHNERVLDEPTYGKRYPNGLQPCHSHVERVLKLRKYPHCDKQDLEVAERNYGKREGPWEHPPEYYTSANPRARPCQHPRPSAFPLLLKSRVPDIAWYRDQNLSLLGRLVMPFAFPYGLQLLQLQATRSETCARILLNQHPSSESPG